jgi:hypothetical protein
LPFPRCLWRDALPLPPRSRFETLLSRRETISPAGEDGLKQTGCIKAPDHPRSSIMWDIIISLIYHRSSRKYLAAVRTQQRLWA